MSDIRYPFWLVTQRRELLAVPVSLPDRHGIAFLTIGAIAWG